MSERNFSRRRRGGMRFRPSGGLGHIQQRPDRDAVQARAEVVGDQPMQEKVYDRRHTQEIDRAENIAAGLPPEGPPSEGKTAETGSKRQFREPHLETPAEVQEDKVFEPVRVPEPSRGIVESIKAAASNLVKKVQRLIKPVKRAHKEVVINAESLETRVAVLEEGRLEEFNIERTTEERLVGSIFKGKVRNLEDGLKAAFVDIGFEKNAFLHYWDIVPSNFDSGVEIVEREGRRREKPKITQKDIPRVYPPGSDIIVQVT
ncbi:MAG: Rne/Rng family ribonuclease, partial [Limisphaerales bacterium]